MGLYGTLPFPVNRFMLHLFFSCASLARPSAVASRQIRKPEGCLGFLYQTSMAVSVLFDNVHYVMCGNMWKCKDSMLHRKLFFLH